MVQRIVETLVDDFDSTQLADVTRWLALDGRLVRLDLTAANSARLDAAVAEFLAAGSAERPGSATRPLRTTPVARDGRTMTIREWARANGYPVSDRGPIPPNVLQGYAAQHAR
jgi:hypothetical protein